MPEASYADCFPPASTYVPTPPVTNFVSKSTVNPTPSTTQPLKPCATNSTKPKSSIQAPTFVSSTAQSGHPLSPEVRMSEAPGRFVFGFLHGDKNRHFASEKQSAELPPTQIRPRFALNPARISAIFYPGFSSRGKRGHIIRRYPHPLASGLVQQRVHLLASQQCTLYR